MYKQLFVTAIAVLIVLNFVLLAHSKDLLDLEVNKYVVLLNSINKSQKKQSLESLYKLGISVQNKIKSDLDQKTYDSLTKKMQGFYSMPFEQSEYEIGIYLNPEFYYNLALKKGTPADIAFFKLCKKTKPKGMWPIYTNQQTDYSGCQIFGKGILVNLYKDWTNFKKQYPKAQGYTIEVNKNMSDLEEILTNDMPCVCDDKASYIKELELFIKTFPNSKLSSKVKTLIQKAKSGEFDNIKDPRTIFQCQSG